MPPTYVASVGVSLGVQPRREYATDDYIAFVPELLGFFCVPLGDHVAYRAGVRLGIDGLTRPEFSRGLRVDERGFYLVAESAVLIDWVVVPSLTLGLGPSFRWISVEASADFEDVSGLQAFEPSLLLHAQLGVGFPIERGRVVLEPFFRIFHVLGDERAWMHVGAELSVGF